MERNTELETNTEYWDPYAFLDALLDEIPKPVRPAFITNRLSRIRHEEVERRKLKALQIIDSPIGKRETLKDDHDAFTMTSVLQRQDTGDADVKDRQAKGIQGPEHPHGSGDETSQASLPATGIVQMS